MTRADISPLDPKPAAGHPLNMENRFRIGQLTKELVAAQAREAADPCALAALIIRQTLQVSLKAVPAGDAAVGVTIEDSVRGGLQGLILGNFDVAKGALLILGEMVRLADDLKLDPTQTLMGAMRGIASLKRLIPADRMDRVRLDIDVQFQGAGEAFREILHTVPDPGRAARPAF